MITHWPNYIVLLLIAVALFLLLITNSRKFSIFILGAIYVLCFILYLQFWTVGFALVKLITGLMALVILFFSLPESDAAWLSKNNAETIFKAASIIFFFVLTLFIYQKFVDFLSIDVEILIGSLFLIETGLILLGFSQEINRVVIGILTLLLGFELTYNALESSLLINGLLSAVTLLIAFAGSYLSLNSTSQEEQ